MTASPEVLSRCQRRPETIAPVTLPACPGDGLAEETIGLIESDYLKFSWYFYIRNFASTTSAGAGGAQPMPRLRPGSAADQ